MHFFEFQKFKQFPLILRQTLIPLDPQDKDEPLNLLVVYLSVLSSLIVLIRSDLVPVPVDQILWSDHPRVSLGPNLMFSLLD